MERVTWFVLLLIFVWGCLGNTENLLETENYLIDPVNHKIGIHFIGSTQLEDKTTSDNIEVLRYGAVDFHCSIPDKQEKLPLLFSDSPNTAKFDKSDRFSVLSEKEMNSTLKHFQSLSRSCHTQFVCYILLYQSYIFLIFWILDQFIRRRFCG